MSEQDAVLKKKDRIYEIEIINDTIIARAHNNDLRQVIKGSNPSVSYSVVFALDLNNIYGQAPPYYGSEKKNKDFKWYYVLKPQDETLRNLTVVTDGAIVWSKCGKAFYFSENGIQRKIGKSDFYTCEGDVKFVSLKI